MNTYKLYNSIIRDFKLRNKIKPNKIETKSFSYEFIRNLFRNYEVVEYTEHSYCCYGEDNSCWVDVESSWLDLICTTKKELNEKCLNSLKSCLKYSFKHKNKNLIYTRKIIVTEMKKNYICVCIPLRDISQKDYYVIFDKTKKL